MNHIFLLMFSLLLLFKANDLWSNFQSLDLTSSALVCGHSLDQKLQEGQQFLDCKLNKNM